MELRRRNVIVTGAASGLGKELTKQLIDKGCRVAAVDINEENLNKLKEEVNSRRIKTYVVDMSSQESIKNFRADYIKDYTDVDVIINNAGIIQPFVSVSELDDKTIDKIMNVNFYGPLHLIRYFMDDLIKDKYEQCIVNVSSMGGFFPFPGQTVYGASKAALKLLTEGLYAELVNSNVHVMAVFPGAINTNITKNSNVEMNNTNGNYKLLEPDVAARQIIKGIEKNKFKLFLGSDSKFLRFLYKLNAKLAIKFISNKMK
jgi:short-subunit dehydrogenase